MRRKTLSDITNVAAGDRETPRPVLFSITEDRIDQLIKENAALLRLLEERNKIIESGGVELQKLRLALQKAHQQNWHLAQANSHMLAELHLGKDRLKALKHELGCAAAALRAKKSRSEEEKKLHKHPENNIISIEVEERISKPIHLVPDESRPAYRKKCRNLCKKRVLSSLSLGSSVSSRKSNEKEKHNLKRRRSVTRRSGNVKVEQSDPAEDLFEIEDLRLPIRSMRVANVHEDNSGETDACSVSPVLDVVVNPAKKETREAGCSTKKQIQGRSLWRAAEKFTSSKEGTYY